MVGMSTTFGSLQTVVSTLCILVVAFSQVAISRSSTTTEIETIELSQGMFSVQLY
jgi:hypothetical protein